MKRVSTIELQTLVTWLSDPSYLGASVRSSDGFKSNWVNYTQEGLDLQAQREHFWTALLTQQHFSDRQRLLCSRNKIGKHLASKGDRSAAGHEVRSYYLTQITTQGEYTIMTDQQIRNLIREEMSQYFQKNPLQASTTPPHPPVQTPNTSPTLLDASSANRLIETMYSTNTQLTLNHIQMLHSLLNRTLGSNERLQSQNLQLVASQFNVEDGFIDKAVEFINDNHESLTLATSALASDPNSPESMRKAFGFTNILLNSMPSQAESDADEEELPDVM